MTQSWALMARLVRSTGFGATGAEVDAAARLGRTAFINAVATNAGSIDPGVTATPPPAIAVLPRLGATASATQMQQRAALGQSQRQGLLAWWLERMVAVRQPFPERLTLAWHGIFATSLDKVGFSKYMLVQNETLRSLGAGRFRDLALAMLTDPAMILWLDNDQNTRSAPNENLAREFLELFALGHGNGYTEADVRQGARALTGWKVDEASGTASPVATQHDDGIKTVLGVTGRLDHVGYCDAVLARQESAPFVLGRLWNNLVSDRPMDDTTRTAVVAAYGPNRHVGAAVTAMLSSAGFDRAAGTRVLSPVEWAVGLARAVGATPGDPTSTALAAALQALGQLPFHPPSVGGWPGGQAWLSSSAISARWPASLQLIALGHVDPVASAAVSSRLDATAHLLGVATWSDRSATALQPFVGQPTHLVAAASMTPEYLTV